MTNPDDTQNRRRQARVPLTSDCELLPKAPAWTLLPDPLPGRTVNITEHGMRVLLPRFSAARYEKWRAHVDLGETIHVTLRLQAASQPVELAGEIVWIQYEPLTEQSGQCSVGILLALLEPEMRRTLEQVIHRVTS